ncbi:enoyl-CoA hydratase/isomerase family protein [Epibacterium sp. SM1979]|uniref:Enoyl-CoA hydratase/isomerase family protein n=2 Tax=Tritonibacter litoralis TaxID=2662264 RepID=A0A843Y834_9RHOB|nr:enoyl-CoA hydratase/isomerase family protein [Tritonibacter litoralis]
MGLFLASQEPAVRVYTSSAVITQLQRGFTYRKSLDQMAWTALHETQSGAQAMTQDWLNRREHGAGIVELQLGNGPSNALSPGLLQDFAQQIAELDASEAVEVILIGSPFKAFSVGTDSSQNSDAFKTALDTALITLFSCQTPTIAVVNGDIHGPGLSLILTCDDRIGVTKSGYSYDGVHSGLEMSAVETVLVNQMLDQNVLRRLALTGQTIGPVAARNYGIIDIVAEDQEDLWMYALREAKAYAALAPDRFSKTKTCIRAHTLNLMRSAAG